MLSSVHGQEKRRPKRLSAGDVAVLAVERSAAGLKLQPAEIIRSMEDLDTWQSLLRRFLAFAVGDRPCFAITEEPRGWSIGHELGNGRALTIDGKPYLSVFLPSITPSLLDEIVESEDFERGFLWLLFKDEGLEPNLADIRAAKRHGQSPRSAELFRLTGDGQVIDWQYPARDEPAIGAEIEKLAKSAGWQVRMSED